MKILAVYRHYWPDTTPYASLLRAILGHLAAQGHEVSVYSAQPSYNDIQHGKQSKYEFLEGVEIRRIALPREQKTWKVLRMAIHVIFWLRAILYVFRSGHYDLILGSSYPPVLSGVCLRTLRWLTGTPYIYHCQDLHPESIRLAGQLPNRWLYHRLLRADALSCAKSVKSVVLSSDMREALEDRGVPRDKIAIINNFALPSFREPSQSGLPSPFCQRHDDRNFQVLFAGNHGVFQGLERIVDAAHLLAEDTSIQFIFMGEGASKNDLRSRAGELLDKTVFFLPHQTVAVAEAAMQAADLGIVSLLPGIHRVAFPSKTITYLSAGCPVLCVVERSSDLAQFLIENEFGYVPQSDDPEAIARTLIEVKSKWLSGKSRDHRQKIKKQCEILCGRERTLNSWKNLIDQLGAVGRAEDKLSMSVDHVAA